MKILLPQEEIGIAIQEYLEKRGQSIDLKAQPSILFNIIPNGKMTAEVAISTPITAPRAPAKVLSIVPPEDEPKKGA